MYNLPVVNQYSVFDEVEDVVKVSQVSDVDDLPSGDGKKVSQSVSVTTSDNSKGFCRTALALML